MMAFFQLAGNALAVALRGLVAELNAVDSRERIAWPARRQTMAIAHRIQLEALYCVLPQDTSSPSPCRCRPAFQIVLLPDREIGAQFISIQIQLVL